MLYSNLKGIAVPVLATILHTAPLMSTKPVCSVYIYIHAFGRCFQSHLQRLQEGLTALF